MDQHTIALIVMVCAIMFLTWSAIRMQKSFRIQKESVKTQKEAAERQKLLIARSAENEQRVEQRVVESINLTKEHIQLTKDLIAEIQGLRDDVKGSSSKH